MIEKRPVLDFITHLVLIVGIIIIALPIWVMFVGATHDGLRMLQVPLPLLPGDRFLVNLNQTLLGSGLEGTNTAPVWKMLLNSLIMALSIAIGKILISLISAFAIVYFKFPFRLLFFWLFQSDTKIKKKFNAPSFFFCSFRKFWQYFVWICRKKNGLTYKKFGISYQ